jgi:hypothetical protein
VVVVFDMVNLGSDYHVRIDENHTMNVAVAFFYIACTQGLQQNTRLQPSISHTTTPFRRSKQMLRSYLLCRAYLTCHARIS